MSSRAVSAFVLTCLAASAAHAQALVPSVARETAPFAAAAVGDDVLAGAHGTGLAAPFRRNVRALSDATYVTQTEQMGQTSRISMDEWWSQTGAALIVANILTGR